MITVLHGENIVASRKELERLKTEFEGEIVSLDGKSLTETDFIQATQSASLLADNRLIIVENAEDLNLKNIFYEVVLWYDKELSKTQLEKFKGYKIQSFKIEPKIFKFCDQISPNNRAGQVIMLRELLKTEEPEFVFIMIVRQFRLMLNPQRCLPWQKAKIIDQAKTFGLERLQMIYKDLLKIDFQVKSGHQPQGLAFALELFLLRL